MRDTDDQDHPILLLGRLIYVENSNRENRQNDVLSAPQFQCDISRFSSRCCGPALVSNLETIQDALSCSQNRLNHHIPP